MVGQTMINVKASGASTRISTFLAGVFLLILVVGLGDTGTGAQRRCSCGRQARQGTSSNTRAGHGARGGVCIHGRVRIASPADARARGEEEITADELPATV